MLRHTHLSLLALAVAIGAAAIYFPASGPGAQKPETARITTPVLQADASRQPAAPRPAPEAAHSDRMRRNFEESPNYAAFIQDAMQRPEEGGRFYALLAYIRCEEAMAIKLSPHPATEGARADAQRELRVLKQRCEGVAGQFQNTAAFMAAVRHANARGTADRLLPQGGWLPTSDRTIAAQRLRSAFASGSSYAAAVALELHVEHLADALSPAFANGAHIEILYRASAAASCEVAGACLKTLRYLVHCAEEGECEHKDLRHILRAGLDPAGQQLFEEATSKLVEIGRSGKSPI